MLGDSFLARSSRIVCLLAVCQGIGGDRVHAEEARPPASAVRWRLLSDNAHYQGPALRTGATYQWEKAPTNPADDSGRRLLDGDRPADWRTTTGWNGADNAVVFDFGETYRFTNVELNFHKALPVWVEIQTMTGPGEERPWTTVARIDAPSEGWNAVLLPKAPPGRHLRVVVAQKNWGVYFREARVYGLRPDELRPRALAPLDEAGQAVLAKDGVAHASIVVDCPEDPKVRQAAWTLHDTLERMTGARLPVFAASEKPAGRRLVVGPGGLARTLGVAIEQSALPGQERYRIHTAGVDCVLAGNDAGNFRGTTHAVYDFLQRLGCGWFSPDPLYHVIPKRSTLAVPRMAVDEKPDFDMRHVWMVRDPVLQDAWRLGGFPVNTAHLLDRLVLDGLREKHPDWFGQGQPCLTHPGVREHIVAQFRDRLDSNPGQFLSFSIGQNDNAGFCECASCRAAGNISARYLLFANAITDALRETHPGRFQLGFLAYWITHDPPVPVVKARPEVTVLIVNEGDHTKPVDAPVPPENARLGRSNLREQTAIAGWVESGALHGVYEWWIPGCGSVPWRRVPWISGETAMRNLRFWNRQGFRYLTYETGYEEGSGFPLRWPLYYVAARGGWNSGLTAEAILREACLKLFGAAAEPMLRYYRTLEGAMLETPHPASNWHLPSAERVYTPEVEDLATACLDEAAGMALPPDERARVASERGMWDRARETLAELRAAAGEGQFKAKLDGESKPWRDPVIRTEALCELFGLPRDAPLQAVEDDGQTRKAEPDEPFDLRTGIQFRRITAEPVGN